MLNTGLLMRRPGESGYGKFRRFMIANRGVYLKPSKPSHNEQSSSMRKYGLARLGSDVEQDFLKSNQMQSFGDVQPIKTRYRPSKCCVSCMRSGYHSYAFDCHWLHQCPVHKEVLVDRCPECFQIWSAYSEVALRKCSTCGYHVKFKNLFYDDPNELEYQALELVDQVVEARAKKLLSRVIIGRSSVQHPFFKQEYYKQAIDAESPVVFAVMRQLNLLTSNELKLLTHITEIKLPEMSSVSCHVKPVPYDQLFKFTDDHLRKERLILEKHFEQVLLQQTRLDANKLNDYETYITDEGVSVEYMPWMLYLIALGKGELFLRSENIYWWELLQLASALRKRYSNHSVVLDGNFNKKVIIENCANSGQQTYIKIPGEIILLLMQAELSALIDDIVWSAQMFQDKKTVSWNMFKDTVENIIKKLACVDFPVALAIRKKQIDVILPQELEYERRKLRSK